VAREVLDVSFVDALVCEFPAFEEHNIGSELKYQIGKYLRRASDFSCSVEPSDMDGYTKQILNFWASHHEEFPAWAKAARIIFSLSPNSAACERVFSLLKLYFGDGRDAALSDQISVALMMCYNKRAVG
jgi:hypothetical protein